MAGGGVGITISGGADRVAGAIAAGIVGVNLVGGELLIRGNWPSRYGLANDHGRGRVLFMRDMDILTIHLITIFVKMLRPGGVRAVAAESLLMKQQLLVVNRPQDSLWSVDLFRVESILLRSHWVMLVMDVFTRRLVGFGVEPADIAGVSTCRMFNRATASQPRPKYLSTDHDPLFRFLCWLANLRVLEIEEIKSVPYAPVSHPFVERLIGTVRREYLDHMFFWSALDLTRKLDEFQHYYNRYRVHRSLDGTTPAQRADGPFRASAHLHRYAWQPHCRSLFQTPIAA